LTARAFSMIDWPSTSCSDWRWLSSTSVRSARSMASRFCAMPFSRNSEIIDEAQRRPISLPRGPTAMKSVVSAGRMSSTNPRDRCAELGSSNSTVAPLANSTA
jgi:hypothetical protein